MELQRATKIINFFRPMVHPENNDDFLQDVLVEMLERERRNGGLPGMSGVDTGVPTRGERDW